MLCPDWNTLLDVVPGTTAKAFELPMPHQILEPVALVLTCAEYLSRFVDVLSALRTRTFPTKSASFTMLCANPPMAESVKANKNK